MVVGDGCADETAEVVGSFKSARVSWHNLEQNTGSQSLPNNVGVARSTGNWIAYMGMTISGAGITSRLCVTVEADSELDFVVSGCVYYGPKDSAIFYVTGIFDSERAQFEHFFPPSSFAHRRRVLDLIGGWREPQTVAGSIAIFYCAPLMRDCASRRQGKSRCTSSLRGTSIFPT